MSKKDNYKDTAKKNKNKKTYESQIKDDEVVSTKSSSKSERLAKKYRNPARTLIGKIIIIILALFMCFSGLATLIYYIITKG